MVFIQLISAASNRFSGVPSELVLSSTSQKDFISVIRSFLSSYSISNFELEFGLVSSFSRVNLGPRLRSAAVFSNITIIGVTPRVMESL
jgi:hypothetical protein